MTIWRPQPLIRVKAIGLHWRNGRLLAAEVRDDSGRLKGVRPLGGSVEFGERAEDALIREFREELGIEVTPVGATFVMENLYRHEGAAGHEILFIQEVNFPDQCFENEYFIEFFEDNGSPEIARWFDLDDLDLPGGPMLFPSGLKDRLRQG